MVLLALGLVSPVLYFGAQLVCGLMTEGYSFTREAASDLGTSDRPYHRIFNSAALATGCSLISGGIGLLLVSTRRIPRRLATVIVAVCCLSAGAAAVTAGLYPLPDARHGGGAIGAGMFLAPFAVAFALRDRVRLRPYLAFEHCCLRCRWGHPRRRKPGDCRVGPTTAGACCLSRPRIGMRAVAGRCSGVEARTVLRPLKGWCYGCCFRDRRVTMRPASMRVSATLTIIAVCEPVNASSCGEAGATTISLSTTDGPFSMLSPRTRTICFPVVPTGNATFSENAPFASVVAVPSASLRLTATRRTQRCSAGSRFR